jgi:hypothetical protein
MITLKFSSYKGRTVNDGAHNVVILTDRREVVATQKE